jgi:hypothetical protein
MKKFRLILVLLLSLSFVFGYVFSSSDQWITGRIVTGLLFGTGPFLSMGVMKQRASLNSLIILVPLLILLVWLSSRTDDMQRVVSMASGAAAVLLLFIGIAIIDSRQVHEDSE